MKVGEIAMGVPVQSGKKGGLSGRLHLPFSCLELPSVPVQ